MTDQAFTDKPERFFIKFVDDAVREGLLPSERTDDFCWVLFERLPDGTCRQIASDHGATEDQCFTRDWAWVTPLLNRLAADLKAAESEAKTKSDNLDALEPIVERLCRFLTAVSQLDKSDSDGIKAILLLLSSFINDVFEECKPYKKLVLKKIESDQSDQSDELDEPFEVELPGGVTTQGQTHGCHASVLVPPTKDPATSLHLMEAMVNKGWSFKTAVEVHIGGLFWVFHKPFAQ